MIRRLPNPLCPMGEESIAEHVVVNGVSLKLGKGNTKGEHGGAQVESGG
jgi:hypothetical protein